MNKQTNQPKKKDKEHWDTFYLHEYTHSIPYYYQKDWWHFMVETLDKRLIKLLDKYIIVCNRRKSLAIIAIQFFNIEKWIANEDIDNELFNNFWNNNRITNSQKTCLLKLRHEQYMDNARK